MACFLLVTFLPERPLLSVPLFRSCIARLTFFPAVLPYFAIALSPSIQLAKPLLRCLQPLPPVLRKFSSRTIDIETDHRHRRAKRIGLFPPTSIRGPLQRTRDAAGIRTREHSRIQIQGVAGLCYVGRPTLSSRHESARRRQKVCTTGMWTIASEFGQRSRVVTIVTAIRFTLRRDTVTRRMGAFFVFLHWFSPFIRDARLEPQTTAIFGPFGSMMFAKTDLGESDVEKNESS